MTRNVSFVAAPLVWLLSVTTLFAAADPLTVIPDNALGLAVVNGLADTSAKLQKLTDKMQLPVPELLPILQSFSGVQDGLDDKGGLALAVFADNHEEATWGMSLAVFVPVTDYQAFIKQLVPDDASATICEVTIMGEKYLSAKKGDFAVLSSTGQKYVIEQILASSENLSGALAPIKPWLAQQQAAIVVAPAGKKLLFEKAGGLLESFGAAATEAGAADDKKDDEKKDDADAAKQVKAVKQIQQSFKELLAAADPELTQLGVGIRIDETVALHVSARVLFTPDGNLSKWAQTVKPPKAGLLAGLPAGKFVIAYGAVTEQLHSAFAAIVGRFADTALDQFGLSAEMQKKYADVMARSRANGLRTCGIMGQIRPGDSIAATSAAVEHVKDAKLYMALTREMLDILKTSIDKSDSANKPAYTVNDIMVGDLKAIEVITDMSAMIGAAGEADGPINQQMQGFFSKLFGNEGQLRVYFTIADDHTIVSAYSKELLERGVAHVRAGTAGLEADAQIAKTDALLPKGSQWAAYVNPQGLLQWVDTLMRQLLPAEMNIRIPPFPPSDPIGLAARVAPDGLDAELVLPDSVVAGIGQYVGLIQQMMQGGAPLPYARHASATLRTLNTNPTRKRGTRSEEPSLTRRVSV